MNNDYLSKPTNANGAGIVLIHEFWGVNQLVKNTADRLAAENFAVLAVDLYKGRVAKNVDEARLLKESVTDEHALERVREGISKLEADSIAVWGFCFGGSVAFKSATANPLASGVAGAYVIYYGSLITDDENVLAKIQKPILGIFGGLVAKVEAMRKNLDALGKINEIYIYPDADHAFANEERDSYNPTAKADALTKTFAFLQKHLF